MSAPACDVLEFFGACVFLAASRVVMTCTCGHILDSTMCQGHADLATRRTGGAECWICRVDWSHSCPLGFVRAEPLAVTG